MKPVPGKFKIEGTFVKVTLSTSCRIFIYNSWTDPRSRNEIDTVRSLVNRKLSGIFYGWWIVGAFFLISIFMQGIITLGFTAFFEPISADFGWNYTQISLAASLRGVEAGLLAPLIGILFDRWGPRKLVVAGVVLISLALVFLGSINSLLMFYVGFAVIALGISGNNPAVVMGTLANWFRKKMGIATGIVGSGFAIGGLLIPLVSFSIDSYGWRIAFVGLGILIIVTCLPLALMLRHKPEPYGYLPDGEKTKTVVNGQQRPAPDTSGLGVGTRQALRSRTFWHLTISNTLSYIALISLTTHIMPYLGSVGVPRTTASLVATAAPLLSIVGRISSGWLSDKYNLKNVSVIFYAVFALGMVCFIYTSSESLWIIIPGVILYGLGWGGIFTVRGPLALDYFGRKNYGSIFGWLMGMVTVGGIIGPLFAGWVYDTYSSYRIAWIIFAVITLISIIILASTPRISRVAGPDK